MASESYHESIEKLTPVSQELHRALQSLKEELDAIDWYQQRIDATQDAELKAILEHNRDEEKEHGAMILEWIRRKDARFDQVLGTYLRAQGEVTRIEQELEHGAVAGEAKAASEGRPAGELPASAFTVGTLRKP